MVFKVHIIIEPDEDRFHAYCPALKGLHVDGSTKEEALENAKEAAIAYLQSLIKHGDPIPINIIPSREESEKMLHLFKRHVERHTEDLQLTVP
jgi:predicted RNase H-like HicB family nuclease